MCIRDSPYGRARQLASETILPEDNDCWLVAYGPNFSPLFAFATKLPRDVSHYAKKVCPASRRGLLKFTVCFGILNGAPIKRSLIHLHIVYNRQNT